MKKFLILFLSLGIFSFTSCSDDDDAAPTQTSIVDTWVLTAVSPPVIDLQCPQPSTITFTANGTASWELYAANNDCVLEDSEGAWEKKSDNNYTIYIPNLQAVNGTIDFDGSDSFTFTTNISGVNAVLSFDRQL
ncbi:hypothetical protein [Salinimicrobium sp. 3283s]|jgi:hypothetical protein|uniref:hypothetical protein n=1 Tax=unclassified Salinimicrobium TaxID=2643747 RepID=UPI0031EAB1C6